MIAGDTLEHLSGAVAPIVLTTCGISSGNASRIDGDRPNTVFRRQTFDPLPHPPIGPRGGGLRKFLPPVGDCLASIRSSLQSRWPKTRWITSIHALFVKRRERDGREANPITAIIDPQSVKSGGKSGVRASIPMVMMWARRSGAKNRLFSSLPPFVGPRDRASGRRRGPRRRRPARVDAGRHADLGEALCRWRLSGSRVPHGARDFSAWPRHRNPPTSRSRQSFCSASMSLDCRTRAPLARPLSATCQQWENLSRKAPVFSRLASPHARRLCNAT